MVKSIPLSGVGMSAYCRGWSQKSFLLDDDEQHKSESVPSLNGGNIGVPKNLPGQQGPRQTLRASEELRGRHTASAGHKITTLITAG